MTDRFACLRLLADGNVHSGTALGEVLGVSRAAVWKQLQQLEQLGLNIVAVAGKGYQLQAPLDLLSSSELMSFDYHSAARLSYHVFSEIDSTNNWLMQSPSVANNEVSVCVAELQHAGRGRRGRQWQSPFASNIYLSFKRRFLCGLEGLAGLSLAVGVACAKALQPVVNDPISVKWPNDLYLHNKKVGGVLIELIGEAGGPCQVVIGVGINVHMTAHDSIDQPWTSLAASAKTPLKRNALIASVVDELCLMAEQFDRAGFSEFVDAYQALDLFIGKPIQITGQNVVQHGVHMGVDNRGALRLNTATGIETILVGDVSLRGGA